MGGSARTEHPPTPAPTTTTRRPSDALAFAALFDRFIQNLRRYLGYDLQYFATIEPQRRLSPHVHIAKRGTISRTEIRRVLAATYYQVWWPDTTTVKYDGDYLPVWDEGTGGYLDPATGEVLPTWDQALTTRHVVAQPSDTSSASDCLAPPLLPRTGTHFGHGLFVPN